MKKKILILAVLGLLVLSGFRVYIKVAKSAKTPSGRPSRAAVAVEVSPVEKKAIRDIKYFTGSLVPREQFTVAPKVAGRLEKLSVNMGDSIQRGRLIAVLDNQEYQQKVEQARAELEVAKASVAESESALAVAKREFERIKELREKKIASESELDAAEAGYKTGDARHMVALAQVKQKQASLKAAEIQMEFTQIRASWEGGSGQRVVGEKYVDEGTMLRANDPIISLMDIDSLTAVIHVTEEDYSKVKVGHPIILYTAAHTGRKFTGTVVRKAPALKEASRTASVEAAVSNPAHLLKPGMFIRAEVELERREGATVIPVAALTKRDTKQGVFLLEEEMKARFVPVETGIVTKESAEILLPPLEGYVVTLGQHLLVDGSSVIIPKSAGGSEEKKKNRSEFHDEIKKHEGDRP